MIIVHEKTYSWWILGASSHKVGNIPGSCAKTRWGSTAEFRDHPRNSLDLYRMYVNGKNMKEHYIVGV
jgi:hypothetical protein